jgi:hypothetical protein
MANAITPAASPITRLGHVRIVSMNLTHARQKAAEMGLLIDQIYGCESPRHLHVACRHLGPMGNHEPRWTDAERHQFAALGC